MYHWTDSKIRVYAFYCLLGVSLPQYFHKQDETVWPGLSVEQLPEELRQIQQSVLLYPPQEEKGPKRVARVLSKRTLPQHSLADALNLDQLRGTLRGHHDTRAATDRLRGLNSVRSSTSL